MRFLNAKNPKQLNLCLRMLYAEKVKWTVDIVEDNNGKIRYEIGVDVTDEEYNSLREKYRILIS